MVLNDPLLAVTLEIRPAREYWNHERDAG